MKRILFATILALTNQYAWGMESIVETSADRSVELKPEEKSLQFLSIYAPVGTASPIMYNAHPEHKNDKITEITAHTYCISKANAGSYQKQLVAVAADTYIKFFALKTGICFMLNAYNQPRGRITCIAFNDDGSLLADGREAHSGHTVVLWNVAWKQAKGFYFFSKDQNVTALTFNPCGSELAVGCDDGAIKLLNYKSYKDIEIKDCHTKAVLALAYNRLGQLASLSKDLTIKIWENGDDGLQCKQTIQLDAKHDILGFYPDASSLFSCNRDHVDKISYWSVLQ